MRVPARYDFGQKIFIGPVFTVDFRPAELGVEDAAFYSFIAAEKRISKVEAIERWNDFSGRVRALLRTRKKADLPGIGLLTREEDEIKFKATEGLNFFPVVGTERAVRPEERRSVPDNRSLVIPENKMLHVEGNEEDDAGESDWWIYAIVLAIIAIAGIVYYYLQHGTIL